MSGPSEPDDLSWYVHYEIARAVPLVRLVHQSRDRHRRYRLACRFTDYIDKALRDRLIRLGIVEVLCEILLDEDTYRFIDPPLAGEVDEYINVEAIVSDDDFRGAHAAHLVIGLQRYACCTVYYLMAFAEHIWPYKSRGIRLSHRACSRVLEDSLPRLWKMWWTKRVITTDPRVQRVPCLPATPENHVIMETLDVESFEDMVTYFNEDVITLRQEEIL